MPDLIASPDWEPHPLVGHERARLPPANVNAFPGSANSFGVRDLVGNVSRWTDEFSDEHTRVAIVRGGASYQPLGSVWYFREPIGSIPTRSIYWQARDETAAARSALGV